MDDLSFTGRTRRRRTTRLVRVVDRLARLAITVGGLATIGAVALILVFLVWVVVPLFEGGSLEAARSSGLPAEARGASIAGVDEYRTLCWALAPDGAIVLTRLDTGERLPDPAPAWPVKPTAAAVFGDQLAFGFADGTIRLGRVRFTTRFLEMADVPEALRDLPAGAVATLESGAATKTPEGQFRVQGLAVDFDPPVMIEPPAKIERIDVAPRDSGPVIAALTSDGRLLLREARTRRNLLTGEVTVKLFGGTLALESAPGRGLPDWLLLAERGAETYAIWRDGVLERYTSPDLGNPRLVERVVLLPGRGAEVTCARFANGRTTVLVGDSIGRVRAWFPARSARRETPDGIEMVMAHEFEGGGSPVTALGASVRTRMFAAGGADGSVRLFHVTTSRLVAEATTGGTAPVTAIALAPRDDGVAALAGGRLHSFSVSAAHADITLRALFRPVFYEGSAKPEHVWQSTGGSDDFEPKLGLVPLVFGTLKATFYSMLFGLPIALLAAVFASEFLSRRVKSKVKPAIEVMASLPSVVLGFLAALVIAPFVERGLSTVLAAFVTVPVVLLFGAYLFQLLPAPAAVRLGRYRLLLMALCLPAGVILAALLSPLGERLLFAGDLRAWLDGRRGGAFGGWFFLLLPLGGIVGAVAVFRLSGRLLGRRLATLDRGACARLDLLRFAAAGVAGVLAAALLALVLSRAGLDTRGALVGTYVQRNALVVGFVMGFAIIPIVFTIAEDALSSVPAHLRSASLGAGATPWQTAVRVVVPTAMSGLFSASMIGLGRAVGETMIVLMAAGNTPVLDLNVFNGFRTLSANLAVELPEAVRDSTHYRTLFLAALTLFAMTFVVNTLAEIVRQRFRRRAFEL